MQDQERKMTRNLKQFYVAGTSALKLYEYEPAHISTARIVKLPCIERVDNPEGKTPASNRAEEAKVDAISRQQRLKNVLDASEMYCSLISEDFKGCRYNLFSKNNVQLLTVAGSAIAIISLVFGA